MGVHSSNCLSEDAKRTGKPGNGFKPREQSVGCKTQEKKLPAAAGKKAASLSDRELLGNPGEGAKANFRTPDFTI
jgi:hypothetical protein